MKPLLPYFAFLLIFPNVATADPPLERDDALRTAIRARLKAQIDDPAAVEALSGFVLDEVLTWRAETLEIRRADAIVAFAFGNQRAPNGNQQPGPMNQQLADLVVKIHRAINKPIYAQWEIARAIGARVPKAMLTPIYPTITPEGEVIYLSTTGVAATAAELAGGADKLGRVVVVAFREHSLRAVRTARRAGMDAYAPAGMALPSQYDPRSGQPWTRNRLAFMLYEIRTRANALRARLGPGDLRKR